MRDAHARRLSRGGFTIVEVAVVMVLIGLLSAIAVPRLRGAVEQAHAAHIIADFSTIRLAGVQYYTATSGVVPETEAPESVPTELLPLLPEGFEFSYEGVVTYRWRKWSVTLPTGETSLAGVEFESEDEGLIARIKQLYEGEMAFGTNTRITLIV